MWQEAQHILIVSGAEQLYNTTCNSYLHVLTFHLPIHRLSIAYMLHRLKLLALHISLCTEVLSLPKCCRFHHLDRAGLNISLSSFRLRIHSFYPWYQEGLFDLWIKSLESKQLLQFICKTRLPLPANMLWFLRVHVYTFILLPEHLLGQNIK